MEEGNWKLKENIARTSETSLLSYISHDCPEGRGRRFWFLPHAIDACCYDCNASPPPGMLGLWKLHNWDYIQRDLQYGGNKP